MMPLTPNLGGRRAKRVRVHSPRRGRTLPVAPRGNDPQEAPRSDPAPFVRSGGARAGSWPYQRVERTRVGAPRKERRPGVRAPSRQDAASTTSEVPLVIARHDGPRPVRRGRGGRWWTCTSASARIVTLFGGSAGRAATSRRTARTRAHERLLGSGNGETAPTTSTRCAASANATSGSADISSASPASRILRRM